MFELRSVLAQAHGSGVAIGHFNISDLVLLKAVFDSAQMLKVPVIVGVSEGERAFLGVAQVAALVKSLREEYGYPIFLNADHTHSLHGAVAAAKAGFDSIVFDLSALPFDENVRQTKEAVEVLKAINPAILVEGEIGDIGTGSEIHEAVPIHPAPLSTPNEAKQFVISTAVDILAPAVGNTHGMVETMVDGNTRKHLNIKRILEIKQACGCLLTLHGGSGTDDQDLRDAIRAGINIIHINTELRVAWRRGIDASLAETPKEVVPYKLLPAVENSVKEIVINRLRIFNSLIN
jgi:fructose-bisphosphate aldolase, class II